jgi:hypothetical protein
MTKEELTELLAEAIDRHKAATQAMFKVDRGETEDGASRIRLDLLGGDCLLVTVERLSW